VGILENIREETVARELQLEQTNKLISDIQTLNNYMKLNFDQHLQALKSSQGLQKLDLGRLVGGMCPFSQNAEIINTDYTDNVEDISNFIKNFGQEQFNNRISVLKDFALLARKSEPQMTASGTFFPEGRNQPHGINWYVFSHCFFLVMHFDC